MAAAGGAAAAGGGDVGEEGGGINARRGMERAFRGDKKRGET